MRGTGKKIDLHLPRFDFIINSYTKSRGTPVMLKIKCVNCHSYIMSYQKDGPGPLKRCYFDRIHHPPELASLQNQNFNKSTRVYLQCLECKEVIGTPMIYEKENRLAFSMRPGFFAKEKQY